MKIEKIQELSRDLDNEALLDDMVNKINQLISVTNELIDFRNFQIFGEK